MKFHALLIITLLFGMLAGCASPPPENKPVSDTAVCGDFTLTLSSDKSVYKAKDLKPGHLLDFKVSYAYTGDKPEIEVWSSSQIYTITLYTSSGVCLLETAIPDELVSSTLLQNKVYTFTYDGSRVYNHAAFKPGDYKAVAWLELSLNEEVTQKVTCKAEIPFTII